MTDTTQGQDVQQADDGSLFREAIDAPTLDKFENPTLPEPKPEPQQRTGQAAPDRPEPAPQDAPVPAGRLREESEARRRAEREANDLRARLAAFEVQPRRESEPPKKADMFDNPSAFVQQEVNPLISQVRTEMRNMNEQFSRHFATQLYGGEKVQAAFDAMQEGMARKDPHAWATYQQAMASFDPYGVITRAHLDRQTLTQIGGDLDSFKKKILDEALNDPEFHKRAVQAAKGHAVANGQQVNRPAVTQSKVPLLPSLSDIGAAGADEQQTEPSEEALFRAAVSAKRR